MVNADPVAGGVDPFGGTFQLGVEADRSLVEDAVPGGVGKFRAPFLVDKRRSESELGEDVPHGFPVLHIRLGFLAVLVTRGRVVVLWQALVGGHPALSILADPQNLLVRTQAAIGRVIEDIALKGARGLLVKSCGSKRAHQRGRIRDGELHFDFHVAHTITSMHRDQHDLPAAPETAKRTLRLLLDAGDLNSDVSQRAIAQAAEILRGGGTVAFPTETVYGLGAHALDAEAVTRIFAAKQRPAWDPLIVHIGDLALLDKVSVGICDNARRLMGVFWPGPLTLLLPKHPSVPEVVTAGLARVGVRMPAHPVTQALLHAAAIPIAAPSANTFGRTSPTCADHVAEDLNGRIDAILDGGETTHGVESTVVAVEEEDLCVIYRPGVVTAEQIAAVFPGRVITGEQASEKKEGSWESLPSPGMALRHYAPRARLILVDGEGGQQCADFGTAARIQEEAGEAVGLMLPDALQTAVIGRQARVFRWGSWDDAEELAQRLFAGLRWLDAAGVTAIVCPLPPAKGIGVAIRDRLKKAAQP